jgi:hypothetical protein
MGVATEPALEGGQGFLTEQIRERGGKRRESDGEAGSQGGLREVLRDHRLAKTAAALEEDVLAAVDELELDETLDEGAIRLLAAVGASLIAGAFEPRTSRAVRLLGIGSAAALGLADVVYATCGRISKVCLGDALAD